MSLWASRKHFAITATDPELVTLIHVTPEFLYVYPSGSGEARRKETTRKTKT
jgi:hypothetical protein